MPLPTIFSEILTELQPVYDVAQFGEDVIFNYNINVNLQIIRPDGTTVGLLVPTSQYRPPSANITRALAAGAAISFRTIIDMPAWIFAAGFTGEAFSPLGSTLQVSITYAPPGGPPQNLVPAFSFAIPVSALITDTRQLVHDVAAIAFVPQHSVITLTITNTGANPISLVAMANPDGTAIGEIWANYLKLHLHPHLNHADYIFGTQRTS